MKIVLYFVLVYVVVNLCYGRPKPKSFRMKYIDADEVIDRLLSDVESEFILFDQNRDGYLSIEELLHVRYAGVQLFTEQELKRDWNSLDTNRDGLINLEEFNGI